MVKNRQIWPHWMDGRKQQVFKKVVFCKNLKTRVLMFSSSYFLIHGSSSSNSCTIIPPSSFRDERGFHSKLFLKMGQSQPLFVYFVLFKHKFYRKNCRRQQDSNSDLWSRRRARWPLDHHHGPLKTFSLKCESDELRWNFWVLIQQILCSIGSLFTWKASSRPLFRLLQLQVQFQSYNFFL